MADIPATAAIFRYFAGIVRDFRGDQIPVEDPNSLIYTLREPLGVIAALIPWNSPIITLANKLAPALATGNTIVIKPSEYASASVLEFIKLISDLLPPGVINVITGFGSESLGVVTTGSTSSISWSWTAVTGAASYIIVVKSTSSTDYTYYFTSATSTFTQTLVPSGGTLLKFEVGASNGNATGGLALTGGIKFNPPGNIYSGLVLANNSITEVNQLRFNDAGANEGLIWDGGNGWRIFESPNDVVTNGAGNLQITQYNNANGTNTRRATFTSGGGLEVVGAFSATTKSFDIEHPTKDEMRLRYGSLEGPENGVYVRGTTTEPIIELPDYWTGLVHEDSITVSLTAVGSSQNIYITEIKDNKVYIGGDLTKAFFTVYGERKDVDKLTVEY
jgi:hypothetical protein